MIKYKNYHHCIYIQWDIHKNMKNTWNHWNSKKIRNHNKICTKINNPTIQQSNNSTCITWCQGLGLLLTDFHFSRYSFSISSKNWHLCQGQGWGCVSGPFWPSISLFFSPRSWLFLNLKSIFWMSSWNRILASVLFCNFHLVFEFHVDISHTFKTFLNLK